MTGNEPYILPGGGMWGGRLIRFGELDSTNSWALRNAGTLSHGDVVTADAQLAGRGRMERSWFSSAGRSLVLSLVIAEPSFDSLAANLGQLAALSVRDMLSLFGLRAMLKWPNDVMVDNKKIAGVLAERADTGAFIVGIGVNMNITRREFAAADLGRPATSLRIEAGRIVPVAKARDVLLARLARRLNRACSEGTGELLAAWRRSDWLRGRWIRLTGEESAEAGHYAGLDGEGRLLLKAADGSERAFWSGDVERVEQVRQDCVRRRNTDRMKPG